MNAEVTIGQRRCLDCGSTKPADDFYRVKRDSDARQSRCKPCDNRKRGGNYARLGNEGQRFAALGNTTVPVEACIADAPEEPADFEEDEITVGSVWSRSADFGESSRHTVVASTRVWDAYQRALRNDGFEIVARDPDAEAKMSATQVSPGVWLSLRQKLALEFWKAHHAQHGVYPRARAIAEAIGMSGLSAGSVATGVSNLMAGLRARGLIEKRPNLGRPARARGPSVPLSAPTDEGGKREPILAASHQRQSNEKETEDMGARDDEREKLHAAVLAAHNAFVAKHHREPKNLELADVLGIKGASPESRGMVISKARNRLRADGKMPPPAKPVGAQLTQQTTGRAKPMKMRITGPRGKIVVGVPSATRGAMRVPPAPTSTSLLADLIAHRDMLIEKAAKLSTAIDAIGGVA